MTPCFSERQIASVGDAGMSVCSPAPFAEADHGVAEACLRALSAPVTGPPLGELARDARRIAVVVSDATRDEPRGALIGALLHVLPRDRVRLVIAAGTHRAGADVVPAEYADLPTVVHDGSRDDSVFLGETIRGTPVRLARVIVDADLVVATGRIRPHYFAGYSGGVKAVFPGCAHRDGILANHRLKADPGARLGRVDDNPCRADMEEAARMLPGILVALNVLLDCDDRFVAAAFGDAVSVHRVLARRAGDVFRVVAPRSSVVVVADRPPVTASLYQASKLLPPAGVVLEPGGTVILVAECTQGAGPADRVNHGIYELGVARQLPRHHVVLVSELGAAEVAASYATYSPSLARALADAERRHPGARPVLLWRAAESIVIPADGPSA